MLIDTADRDHRRDVPPAPTPPADPGDAAGQGVTADISSLRAELAGGSLRVPGVQDLDRDSDLQLLAGQDALWVILRWRGRAGLALRAAHCPGGSHRFQTRRSADGWEVRQTTLLGQQRTVLSVETSECLLVRATTSLVPSHRLRPARQPRDLYPLGPDDDPLTATGRVEAAQRGLNSRLCFFRLDHPGPGFGLYFQNLTALNPYFRLTGTKPDGVVGGHWPELGYRPPEPAAQQTLPPGRAVTLSDTFLAIDPDSESDIGDEPAQALSFLRLQAAIYRRLDMAEPAIRDWPARAGRTLRDLEQAADATLWQDGYRYIRPYLGAEPPDSMVQCAVLAALDDQSRWQGRSLSLRTELSAGLDRFHDSHLGMLQRYLPDVGDGKNPNAVDSWYLYHPLLNLGHLALAGDDQARRLFMRSISYAVRAARHFGYRWPIHFDARDFSIIQAGREDGRGQTDVGGLYACVMLLAHQLTRNSNCLDEAARAIEANGGQGFDLNYQANLTAWGAAACAGLWRATGRLDYLHRSYVYLASFLHNCSLWESEIGHAAHYRNFLGATALHNAPYMAIYECSDSFRAFGQYVQDGGAALDPAARLLVAEYCRHALDRAWFYYPDALPPEALAAQQRNGHIDRGRSFPVEDLYIDGQPAGQVGQEIYGAGAAFIFATRAFHRPEGAPFTLYCDHFLFQQQGEAGRLSFHLLGGDGLTARMRLMAAEGRKLPTITVQAEDGHVLDPRDTADRHLDFALPAFGRITIAWAD